MTSFEPDWRPYIRIDLEPSATEDELDRLLSRVVDITDAFGKEVSYDLAVSGGAIRDSLLHRPIGSGKRLDLIMHIAGLVEQAEMECPKGSDGAALRRHRHALIAKTIMDHLWQEHPLGH